MNRGVVFLLLGLFCLIAPVATAHEKSVSYSTWSIGPAGEHHVQVSMPARQATLLFAAETSTSNPVVAAGLHFLQELSLVRDGSVCTIQGPPQPLALADETVAFEMVFVCPQTRGAWSITSDAFFDLSAGHLHFVRIIDPIEGWFEGVITTSERNVHFDPANPSTPGTSSLTRYLVSGGIHILKGPDHLAFLLGLFLLLGWRRRLFLAVTGFTLGHSITLALAAGGIIETNTQIVELLIAFTVWLLAAEVLWQHAGETPSRRVSGLIGGLVALFVLVFGAPGSLGLAIGLGLFTFGYLGRNMTSSTPLTVGFTALFGLLHGFGFASALSSAFSDPVGLGWRLLAFNLGVEIGQVLFLIVLAGLAGAVMAYRPSKVRSARISQIIASGLALVGAVWFVSRIAESVSA